MPLPFKVKLLLSDAILVHNLAAIIVMSFSESLESVIHMNKLLFQFLKVPVIRYQTNNFVRFRGNGGCVNLSRIFRQANYFQLNGFQVQHTVRLLHTSTDRRPIGSVNWPILLLMMERRDPHQFLTIKLHYAKFVATKKTIPRHVEINTIQINFSME